MARRSAGRTGKGAATAAVLAFPAGDPPLLVRIPATSGTWAETLPPLPSGSHVTVAFSDADVEAEHGEALGLLGYESVGLLPPKPDRQPTVDLLIPRAEADRWPLWRDGLLDAGGRVFDLAFGPVATMLGPAIAVHQRSGDA